jgi:fructose-1,6-bisphosphatase
MWSIWYLFLTFLSGQIPKKGKIYSVNEGNVRNWDGPTAKYVVYFMIVYYLFSDYDLRLYFMTLGMLKNASFPRMVPQQNL